jgi:hypothetical protein
MSSLAALLIAAATVSAPAPAAPQDASGVQVASAQARATIVSAVAVRQASGLEPKADAPVPQITRRGTSVLVEFQ